MSFYPEQLSTFKYYKQKIPLFYRDSFGFTDQFEALFSMILNSQDNGIIFVGDLILNLINIFDPNYMDLVNSLDPNGLTCDLLDKLASIFAVTRHPICRWTENGTDYEEVLTLTNEELLMLIKCEIIKNNFQGTREECNHLYDLIGLNIFSLTVEDDVATCKLVLASTPERPYSNNIKKMFKSGLLNIQSMGITYEFEEQTISSSTLTWDSSDPTEVWDFGAWSA